MKRLFRFKFCQSNAALPGRLRFKLDRLAAIALVMTSAWLFSWPCRLDASDLKPVVGPRIRMSPPGIGYHGLIDLAIDRDAPNNILACGYRYSPPQNATIGYVYASQDRGLTWREVLKDDSSIWVTEDSCASGAGGKAFFMGESQLLEFGKVRTGIPLDQSGDIHLYTSLDDGQNWSMLNRHAWIDSSAMAVDSTHGPMRGRMYLFGADEQNDSSGSFSMPQVITTDDGATIHGPVLPRKPAGFRYRGAYAAAARVLPNGTVVAVFMARRRAIQNATSKPQPAETHVEIFATRDGGETMEQIADLGSIQPCIAAMPSLDVNAQSGVLYAAWGTLEANNCQLIVASSVDEGRTWSPPKRVPVAGDAYDPEIAVNEKGMVGLLWTDRAESHCWRFSISSDMAKTFGVPVEVSRCVPTSKQNDLSNSAYATPYVHSKKDVEGWDVDFNAIGVSVVAARDGMLPWRAGLAADSDGDFHAAWPEATDEAGSLWSATVVIKGAEEKVDGALTDVSHSLSLELLNSAFDPASGVYAVDVIATNTGGSPIKAPISLSVDTAYSQFFDSIHAIGSDERAAGKNPAWILWPQSGRGLLTPGQQTTRRRLSFLLRGAASNPAAVGDLLAIRMKAFSPQ